MDVTKAQFPNVPNVAGQETFSYAELLAQLTADLAPVLANPNIGKGLALAADDDQNLADNLAHQIDWAPDTAAIIAYEDFDFYSDSDSTALAIIPDLDPPIQRVAVWATMFVQGTSGYREIAVEKNFNSGAPGTVRFRNTPTSNSTFFFATSGAIPVDVGDRISIEITVSGAGGVEQATNQRGGLYIVL